MNVNEIPVNANPLDLDYSQVDIKRATLAGGLPYQLLVKKCEVQSYGPNSKHPGSKFLYIELSNASPATGPTGDVVNAGQVTIFDRINLEAFGKMTKAQVAESIARFQQGVGIAGPLSQVIQSAAGRMVTAKVKLTPAGTSPAGKSFPEKNEIDYYVKAK